MSDENQIEQVYAELGTRIRVLRQMNGVTQDAVSNETGLSRPSIANIEAGTQRVLLHYIGKIAVAIGSSPNVLLNGLFDFPAMVQRGRKGRPSASELIEEDSK